MFRRLACLLFHRRDWSIVSAEDRDEGYVRTTVRRCRRCGRRWVSRRWQV